MIPEAEAQKFLDELGIVKLPVIPRDICQQLDISYCEKPLKTIDGFFLFEPSSGNGLISVNSLIKERGRKKFHWSPRIGAFLYG